MLRRTKVKVSLEVIHRERSTGLPRGSQVPRGLYGQLDGQRLTGGDRGEEEQEEGALALAGGIRRCGGVVGEVRALGAAARQERGV